MFSLCFFASPSDDSIEDMLTTLEGWREKTTDMEDKRTAVKPLSRAKCL